MGCLGWVCAWRIGEGPGGECQGGARKEESTGDDPEGRGEGSHHGGPDTSTQNSWLDAGGAKYSKI